MTAHETIHDWATGLRMAREAGARHLREHAVVVVGITGPVGSGKTTFARQLVDHSGLLTHAEGLVEGLSEAGRRELVGADGLIVSTDHYLPDYQDELGRDRMPAHERDEPRHADLPLLVKHLRDLRAGRAIDRPVWSFLTHKREGAERLTPPVRGVIAVEGIHALASVDGDGAGADLPDAYHLRVFVETPAGMRKARFVQRDAEGERGMGVEEAGRFFDGVADPTFERFAAAYRARADVVVRGDSGA